MVVMLKMLLGISVFGGVTTGALVCCGNIFSVSNCVCALKLNASWICMTLLLTAVETANGKVGLEVELICVGSRIRSIVKLARFGGVVEGHALAVVVGGGVCAAAAAASNMRVRGVE